MLLVMLWLAGCGVRPSKPAVAPPPERLTVSGLRVSDAVNGTDRSEFRVGKGDVVAYCKVAGYKTRDDRFALTWRLTLTDAKGRRAEGPSIDNGAMVQDASQPVGAVIPVSMSTFGALSAGAARLEVTVTDRTGDQTASAETKIVLTP